jgi:two-component system OmpR family sensor kinase
VSLRARLLLTSVVLVAAGLIAANVATYRLVSSSLFHRIDDQLVSGRSPAARQLSVGSFDGHGGPGDGGSGLPFGTYVAFRDSSGRILTHAFLPFDQSAPAPTLPSKLPLSTAPSDQTYQIFNADSVTGGEPRYRVIATAWTAREVPQGTQVPGTLILAIPLTETVRTLHNLLVVEGLVSLVVLLAVAGLAWWLVRLGLRPLEGIGQTAGAIAAGDLTRRVEPADERTEIGRLGLSLNAMLSQIEAAFEERRASESRLRRFVGDASHELRTPLTSIRGYAELFRRGADSRPQDLAKTMRAIEAEASRMGLLVDDLLLLARLDQGRPLDREPVNVGRIAAEAVESARAIEPDRPIALDVGGPAVVTGDQGRLRQVLDNLLDNVRGHTPAGTAVSVTVGVDDAEVVLTVADRGPGLPPEVASRVFERFYRGDPARSRRTGGAGLGLSIVSAIVEAHGGSVRCLPSEGSGATFEVRLPIRAEEPAASEEAQWAPAAAPPYAADRESADTPNDSDQEESASESRDRETVRSPGALRSGQPPRAG